MRLRRRVAVASVGDVDVPIERDGDRVERRAQVGRGARHPDTPVASHAVNIGTTPTRQRGTFLPMGRQCARSGCSAAATATFTFDAYEQTVWLDTARDGNARAGELCERHANTLTPPRGWHVDDRRA